MIAVMRRSSSPARQPAFQEPSSAQGLSLWPPRWCGRPLEHSGQTHCQHYAPERQGANATVTIVHTGTKNLESHCKRADILIVAAGVPGLVKPEWIKPRRLCHRCGGKPCGREDKRKDRQAVPILKGDVDFDKQEIAGAITPVPGGVGQ